MGSVYASARVCVFVFACVLMELVDVWGLVGFFKERRGSWNLPAE